MNQSKKIPWIERSITLSLTSLLIAILFFKYCSIKMNHVKQFEASSFEEVFQEIEEKESIKNFIKEKESPEKNDQKKSKNIATPSKVNVPNISSTKKQVLFSFNPNTTDSTNLLKLGFKPYVIKNLMSYRKAGGSIRKTEDLKKIYGLDSTFYKKIEPYITIPAAKKKVYTQPSIHKKENKLLDINKASFGQLMSIDSMTTKIAGRIIRFREKLGGFYSLDQLDDVYEINVDMLPIWKNHLVLGVHRADQIQINVIDEDSLSQHPYISRKQAKSIKNYIDQHGQLKSQQDFEKIKAFSPQDINQLAPYLAYEKTH